MKQNWIALIPAYEPEPILLDLLQHLSDSGFQNIVVDDGSGRRFADLFQRASQFATVLTYPENKGKGYALKTGFRYIQEHIHPEDIIVTLDADGQHKVEDAIKLCKAAQEKPDTLMLGSRKLKENVPIRSQFGNTITRLIYRLSTGLSIHDTQTGLRSFHHTLLPKLLQVEGERYEYEMNILLEFASQGIPIQEIEIETIYLDDNSSSHFDTIRDSYRIYKEIIKFSASSLMSFAIDYTMYSLLLILTARCNALVSLRLSNIGARIISASVNYTLNRKFVFKSDAHVIQSALQYILLASIILLGNTCVLGIFVEQLGMNRFIAKILTEMIFFVLNWLIQRCIIFRKRG